ncbi:MAG: low-specificity L-threonine aldolase [Planctomycetes bacterium]|nr:low-specificity L-threonine aldolase [Planctomycetota bacterium]
MPPIDLRSDTVTRPDEAMYEALREAPLGDDVFGDDPTARRLEERAAELLGKEAALFVPSGTMGNSIAIAVSTRPGDEAIVEASAHSVLFEVGGAARLWGVQMLPLAGEGGAVPVEAIRAAVKPRDIHIPRTRLVILEQTSNLAGGRILPLPYLREVGELRRELGLGFHLDGARLFNAAVATGVPARDFAACADTVMFCLSKGLGAPAGSVLTGPRAAIDEGRRVRKLLGGGLRQAGILAACGLHALERNVARLAEDHANARALAEAVRAAGIPGVEATPPDTNMVYVRVRGAGPEDYRRRVQDLRERGVLALAVLGKALRLVFHKDVTAEEGRRAARVLLEVLAAAPGAGSEGGSEGG